MQMENKKKIFIILVITGILIISFGIIRKSIKNDSYTTLINVINDNWSGEDKDYFLKELNTELNGLDQYLKKTENKVSMDFNNAYYEFLTFQNHNKI